jgi:hypothetical protein
MIKFKFYKSSAALNSVPIFTALEKSVVKLGNTCVEQNEDVAVIWSVLWNGRMRANQQIYEHRKKANKITMIVEVGNLARNITWRISLDHVNKLGYFGNQNNLDQSRPSKLKLDLDPPKKSLNPAILIACQHEKSLQWQGLPTTDAWVEDLVKQIRLYSNRPIIIRSHPRSRVRQSITDPKVKYQIPRFISNSYDDFDVSYDYHCVVNHNSGPGIQAAIYGTPIICDSSSLAFPVSDKISNIENLSLKDRETWLVELSHTEWTVEEIDQGIPLARLLPEIKNRLGR